MTAAKAGVEAVAPEEAWRRLSEDPKALLVDVRTRAEWTFVGAPDLGGIDRSVAFVEWVGFPPEGPNRRFLEQLDSAVAEAGARTVLFICRSGARSLSAAEAAQAHFARLGAAVKCVNVAEGFEGDLDGAGRRGAIGGWKARGLPWRQS